jgi:hypothetical protein
MRHVSDVLVDYLNPRCQCGKPALERWRVCADCWQIKFGRGRSEASVPVQPGEQLELGVDDGRPS